MNEKSTVEMAEERAELCRHGAENYANLCGVLTGFVARAVTENLITLARGKYEDL